MVAPLLASSEIQYEYETVLEAKLYHNGTIDRSDHDQIYPTAPANTDKAIQGALSRDLVIDSSTGIWVRLYVPERALAASEGKADRLPIILYYHGGGFVLFSAASADTHEYCCNIAARLGAMVVSVEYRLAPEHKLPVAFEDGLSALKWLQAQGSDEQDSGPKDPWLSAHGDFAKCFIMGHSAGATIVHQTVLNAAIDGFDPLKIRGLILGVPFFGGIERTSSEIEYGETDFLTLQMTDAFWGASLPDGADRSHPYCTFHSSEMQALLNRIELPPSLVIVGALDPLYDRQIEYVDFLQKAGNDVSLLEYPHYGHHILYPEVLRQEDVEEAFLSMQQFLAKRFN